MKKLFATLLSALLITPVFANPAHGHGRPLPPPRHYHGHGGPVYHGVNPWWVITPLVIGGVAGYYAGRDTVYVEREVLRPSPATRMINGVVHEQRIVFDDACRCERVVWVPVQ